MSIAIFGQAYFYENLNGWRSEANFRRNEEQFWEGKNTLVFKLPNKQKETELTLQEDGSYTGIGQWRYMKGDFKIEEEEGVGDFAVSSHVWCQRVFELPLLPFREKLGRL